MTTSVRPRPPVHHLDRPASRGRVRRSAAIAAALALGLGACGAGSGSASTQPVAGESPAPAASSSPAAAQTRADAAFVAGMLPHHKGGIALGELAATKGVDADIRRLGKAIMAKQTEELATLEQLAQRLGAQPAMSPPIEKRDMRDLAELRAADGKAFDKLWLDVISGHHAAAIQMATIERDGGQDAQTTALAEQIIATQSRELSEFNALVEGMS